MNWIKAGHLADAKVLPYIVLEERENFHAKRAREARGEWEVNHVAKRKYATYKSYAVIFKGKQIGLVEHTEESSHRKAGRLIMHTSYLKRWTYSYPGSRYHGVTYISRKSAIDELLAHLIVERKLRPR